MHSRLIHGIGALVLIFWLAGISAVLLTRASAKRFEARFQGGMRTIETTRTIRTLVATLNTRFLPELAGTSAAGPGDRLLFDEVSAELAAELESIKAAGTADERWRSAATRLEEALVPYLEGYERYFQNHPVTPEERQKLHQFISSHTQRVVDLTDSALTLAEGELRDGAAPLSGNHLLFAGSFILLGSVTGILVYFHLSRHLVEPVAALQRSIEEIRKGNFDPALPQAGRKAGLATVVAAFNEMAAELGSSQGRNDENLRRANIVNRAILEAIPSPVFVLADDGGFLQVNPAAEALSESLGIAGRLPAKIQHILNECRETRSHYLPQDPRDALVFRVDEEEFFYLPRIFRFDSENNSLSGWAVLLHNVSRIRWLDDMKTNLLTTVSHEIKTPLTGIRMVLLLLLEDRSGNLDAMQRTLVTSASADCERLLTTLNKLLDLSRAESGSTHLNRIPLSLLASVEAMSGQLRDAAAGRRLTLRVERGGEEFPKVLADPVRLSEVVSNLVANAIEHSPEEGEIVLKVSKPDGEHIRLSVIDQGPGVPAASQSRIFERFYRAPGQEGQGLGLGLFICRDIMIAHEGRIGLLERSNDLTEFFIDVPIA
jgi:two-component system, NtrC family, sensor histidine kinase KinB